MGSSSTIAGAEDASEIWGIRRSIVFRIAAEQPRGVLLAVTSSLAARTATHPPGSQASKATPVLRWTTLWVSRIYNLRQRLHCTTEQLYVSVYCGNPAFKETDKKNTQCTRILEPTNDAQKSIVSAVPRKDKNITWHLDRVRQYDSVDMQMSCTSIGLNLIFGTISLEYAE